MAFVGQVQVQNTCIFSTEFGLNMMGDIAEAGADPNIQLAFTLSNGFTLGVAYFARRIWAVTMKEK